MKSWYLTEKTPTSNGNDLATQFGHIKTVEGLEALRVRIDAELQIVKGELQDPEAGVDYFGIILSNVPLQMKAQEITRVVMKIPDVQSITLVGATQNKRTHALTMNFLIQSTYGTLEYNKDFEVSE